MEKKTIWTYDTSSWNREDIRDEYEQETGIQMNDETLENFIELTNSYYLNDERDNVIYFENTHLAKDYLICGTLGLWNRTPSVYKVVHGLWNAISKCLEDYNSIYYEDSIVKIEAIHHDGTNVFSIKEITTEGVNILDDNPELLNQIIDDDKYCGPVSLYKEMYGY